MKVKAFFHVSLWLVILSFSISCGKLEKDSEKKEDPNTGPSSDNPKTEKQTSSAKSSNASANTPQLWATSSTHRFIVSYDLSGNRLSVVDLSNYAASGNIGGLTFLNRNTLIAFLDPGTTNERFVKIDLNGDAVSAVNPGWFSDTTNFLNVTVPRMIKQSDSRFLVVKQGVQIEALGFSLATGIVTRLGNPWIGTINTCLVTANQYIGLVSAGSGTTKLIGYSSGANTRINVYGSITTSPTCDSSYNYTTAFPAGAAYVPVGAAQALDGRIYVRYQHATTPQIVRYNFDGTTLSAGASVMSDTGYLSADTVSREFTTTDGKNFYFANWTADSILNWNVETGETQFLIHDGFSTDVNAIAIRPAN